MSKLQITAQKTKKLNLKCGFISINDFVKQ